jgi:hypothetical protein
MISLRSFEQAMTARHLKSQFATSKVSGGQTSNIE